MSSVISIKNLTKTYATGFQALKNIDLDIRRGKIFALLGPNGAGKTTLIGTVCGIVNPTTGTDIADGHNVISDFRAAWRSVGTWCRSATSATAVACVALFNNLPYARPIRFCARWLGAD